MWERFEELMKAKRLRIADVARETGISYSTFTDWKAGRYTPKADKIQKLADFFDVSYEYIMGTTNKKKNNINQSTLKDNIMKGFMRSLNNENEFPVYVEDNHGSGRIIKAKLVAVEPYDEDEIQTIETESTTDDPNDAFFNSLSDEQKEEITRLYQLYQKADPAHRMAVEALLRETPQESGNQQS